MAELAKPHRLISVEEYLALEEQSDVRHEYVGGMVYAMVGATKRHNRIVGNIYAYLLGASRGGPCRVYVESVKLRVEDIFYYPDVMVACGPENDDPLVEDAPSVVVEVASPGTEAIDRREKMLAYRRIPTVEVYLIAAQDERRVERHWRDETGAWWHGEAVGDRGRVPVPPLGTELPLAEVYRSL
jgi:Uma2 family endonuclease